MTVFALHQSVKREVRVRVNLPRLARILLASGRRRRPRLSVRRRRRRAVRVPTASRASVSRRHATRDGLDADRHNRGDGRVRRRGRSQKRPGLRRAVETGGGGEGGRRRGRLLRPACAFADVCRPRSWSASSGRAARSSPSTWGRYGRKRRPGGCRRRCLGLVAEYHRRSTAERTADAKRRAIDAGVPPFPNVPPGYRRRKDGRLEPDKHADRGRPDAFELRADRRDRPGGAGTSCAGTGLSVSFHGVQAILRVAYPSGRTPVRRARERARARGDRRRGDLAEGAAACARRVAGARSRSGCSLGSACCAAERAALVW